MNTPQRILAGIARQVPVQALTALLLLGVSLPAPAALRVIEQAYELARNQVRLPDKPEGSLTVRPCPTCKPVVLQVTPATAWFTGPGTARTARPPEGQAAVLTAFKDSAINPRTLVYIYYEPQTRRVKRIVLDVPAPVVQR